MKYHLADSVQHFNLRDAIPSRIWNDMLEEYNEFEDKYESRSREGHFFTEGWGKLAEENPEWYYKLGIAYTHKELGGYKSFDDTYGCFEQAASENYSLAQYYCALHYLGDKIVQVQRADEAIKRVTLVIDEEKAEKLLRDLIQNGHSSAKVFLGEEYEGIANASENKEEAMRWIRIAANAGINDATYHLGLAYRDGIGTTQDKINAFRLFEQLAMQKHVVSQLILAEMYWNGEGIIKDEREAYIWWLIAETCGDKSATDRLRDIDWQACLSSSVMFAAREAANGRLLNIDNNYTKDLISKASD